MYDCVHHRVYNCCHQILKDIQVIRTTCTISTPEVTWKYSRHLLTNKSAATCTAHSAILHAVTEVVLNDVAILLILQMPGLLRIFLNFFVFCLKRKEKMINF